MGQIPFKKITANKPGQDTRGDNKPDQKAKVASMPYKQAIMGRSKFGSKKGVAGRDVHLA